MSSHDERREFRPVAGNEKTPAKKPDTQSGYGKNSGKENEDLTRDDNKGDPVQGPNA